MECLERRGVRVYMDQIAEVPPALAGIICGVVAEELGDELKTPVYAYLLHGATARVEGGSLQIRRPGSNGFVPVGSVEQVMRVTDMNGTVVHVNPRFCEKCGEISGRPGEGQRVRCARCPHEWEAREH